MNEEAGKPATKIMVDEARLREIIAERGLKAVDQVIERAKEKGITMSLSTFYGILQGKNFTKESIERLAQVLEVDLSEFVSFEPEE